MFLCLKSLISLRESLRLFPIAPCFSLKAPIFMPDSISMTGLKVLMILSSKPPCLFLTAHSGKVSILRSRNQPKIAVNQWFSPLIAVVWPSEIPSVLSGINRIFTVASMIFRSSIRLGCAMYIRSICNLS